MEPWNSPHTDSLFIGYKDGTVAQWSIRQKKLTKDYGKVTGDHITTMRTTPDKKHLILGDNSFN
jgi:hypothetical protein